MWRSGRIGLVVAATALLSIAMALPAAADSVGVQDPVTGIWYLRDGGGDTTSFYYGNPSDTPLMGDWDCDGVDTPGLYRQSDGYVYLRNSNTQGTADTRFFFGNPGDVPLAGDFDGDGCDTVSVYRPSELKVYIIDDLGSDDGGLGFADTSYAFGDEGDQPMAGDFDGDGVDEIAMYRTSEAKLYVKTYHGAGAPVTEQWFGAESDITVAGDFDDDGVAELASYRNGVYHGLAGDPFVYGGGLLNPVGGEFGPLPGGGDVPPERSLGALAPGDSGREVETLQQRLTEAKLYRGPIDGKYGAGTQQAVMAFHKINWLPRTWDWTEDDWDRLAGFEVTGFPTRVNELNRVEVDLTRQVLVYFVEGQVEAILPISSGNGELFEGSGGRQIRATTPQGDFKVQRHIVGWRISYLGGLWNPWYFRGGYALHGSLSVPAAPASHGCVRLTMWDSDWLESRLVIGLPVHVWD